jgi:uncharacterized protein (DUF2235 family)
MTPPPASPRNIVLLSDGTGNSSAKLMKTNVWRMYEALDLSSGDQVASYDNGVGTSSFKPFAVLGGAFGWGLKRNVRNLYMFACRNYRPGAQPGTGDRLYAFGFSRGAYTARVLIGLIEHQGLIAGIQGTELERHAKWAYREYRRQFNATKGIVTPLRRLRDVLLRTWERLRRQPHYDPAKNRRVRVAFVGLWDMVDAYGLPTDEMTRGWDQWVWPLSMRPHDRPGNVDKICHAVALDDERQTFHPVLFDEREQLPLEHTDREAITQVWFAGAHSNVGGGYPDDSLARVSLRWMASEACKTGLRLHNFVRDEWEAHADPNGPANDSRRGLGAYYRYLPRSIKKLTADRFADVVVPLPKIHESAMQRIVAARHAYAPIVLPEKYGVVTEGGAIVGESANPFEHPTQSASRCAEQERVWNLVWLRRVLYFSTIAVTLALILPPFVFSADAAFGPSPRSRALSAAIDVIGGFLPDMLQPLREYYRLNPVQFVVLAATLALLMLSSSRVQQQIRDRMRLLWDTIAVSGPAVVQPGRPPTDLIYRLRTSWAYRNLAETLAQRLFPFIFGIGALLLIVLVVAATVNRFTFAVASASGSTCAEIASLAANGGVWNVLLPNRELCHPTGVRLERGHTYRVAIELPATGWSDASHPVSSLSGFSSLDQGPVFLIALPFRRVLTARWFVPIARIGTHSAEYHVLDQPSIEIVPRASGQLFLFVNDAIGPPWDRSLFYDNNRGDPARVTVTTLVSPAS